MSLGEPKRDHAAVWQALHDGLSPVLRRAGFLPHPAYPVGYDPATRSYEAVFLGRPARDGLRLVYLSYGPHEFLWHVTGQHYACPDATERIARLGGDPEDWTAELSSLPRRRNDLVPSAGWAFWRSADRLIDFNDRTGAPRKLDACVKSALRALPEFLEDLLRPAPGRMEPPLRK